MTDKQAARIEKLLRFHAYQLNNIFAELIALAGIVAPDDLLRDPKFKEMNAERASGMKNLFIEVMNKLNADVRAENKAVADEMKELSDLFGKVKN
jgi:hypothetical protein